MNLEHLEASGHITKKKPKVASVMPAENIPPTMSVSPVNYERRYVVFKLVKKKRGRVYVDGICDNVMNPNTNRRERIWLITGADSIWQSELTELLKDKNYVGRNRRSLLFEDGVCRILVDDDRALEFARHTRVNVGKNRTGAGKYDFYEYDPAVEQQERLKEQMTRIETILKVREMPVSEMKKLAAFFGIVFYDDFGMPKSDDGVRSELMLKADVNPQAVNKYIGSEEVSVSYMIKKAISESKIDLTNQAGNAIWASGSGFISKIPAGRHAHEYLTELAMTNSDEGRRFKEQLQTYS